jgi:hypothetical protein
MSYWILPSSGILQSVMSLKPTFRDHTWLKMGPVGSPETSVQTTVRCVTTQKTEEFIATAAEAYDKAHVQGPSLKITDTCFFSTWAHSGRPTSQLIQTHKHWLHVCCQSTLNRIKSR